MQSEYGNNISLPNSGPDTPKRTVTDQLALLGHGYERRSVETIFEKPEMYMEIVNKDCMYSWSYVKDSNLKSHLRADHYRLVQPNELRDDTQLPFDIGKLAGEPCVVVGDLVLVEVQPRAVVMLYKSRAIEGIINAHGDGESDQDVGQDSLKSQMAEIVGQENLDNGTVKVKFTKKTETKSVTEGE
jgi:hypothetical protein